MRIANTALIRHRVQIPTVDEILRKMEGATIFTEVDLSQECLQVTLAEESWYITAFLIPEGGSHRFTRVIMGASPCGEHFHEIIHDLINEISGVANISDNIWIWSRDKATHLQQLNQLLTKLETSGITLKLPKCSQPAESNQRTKKSKLYKRHRTPQQPLKFTILSWFK